MEVPDSSLRDRLNAWTWRGPSDVLDEAASSGERGAELLAEQLRDRTEWSERIYLAAALGDGSGPSGIEELGQAATSVGPHTTDLRCVALLALSKRCESEATADLLVGLSDRSGAVRRYAMLGLAAYGTADAWDAAFTQLGAWLRRPSKLEPSARSNCGGVLLDEGGRCRRSPSPIDTPAEIQGSNATTRHRILGWNPYGPRRRQPRYHGTLDPGRTSRPLLVC